VNPQKLREHPNQEHQERKENPLAGVLVKGLVALRIFQWSVEVLLLNISELLFPVHEAANHFPWI